jgi:hypothetical protein
MSDDDEIIFVKETKMSPDEKLDYQSRQLSYLLRSEIRNMKEEKAKNKKDAAREKVEDEKFEAEQEEIRRKIRRLSEFN